MYFLKVKPAAPARITRPIREQSRTVRLSLLTLVVLAALAAFASPSNARSGSTACAPRTIGPGSLLHGGDAGAVCLLRAYGAHCTPASYSLSRFGVDTIGVDEFQVSSLGGKCGVDLTISFRVVPQKPRVTAHGRCGALGRKGTDIVASRCTGSGVPSAVSLTHGP